MPQVALEQATIPYRVFGPEDSTHPPLLFVHGILADERLWVPVAEGLARQGFRCILPTWPLGAHTVPANDGADLSPRGIAELVNDFIVALDLVEVTLIGNDTGGGLCQFVIDRHPDRIGRLVLTNCDAFDQFPPFPFNAIFALLRGPRSIKTLFAALRWTPLRHSPIGYGLLLRHPDPELTRSWLTPCANDTRICRDLAHLLRQVAVTDLTDEATRFGRFAKPVTLIWGMRDRCFTPDLARRMAELFPNCTMIEVPDATTFVALDNPAA